MIEYDRYAWWGNVFRIKGGAIPSAAPRVALFTGWAILVQGLYELAVARGHLANDAHVGIDPVGHAVMGSLVGFLIVFRMNASNSRYWEGRSHWGSMINASRNLIRVGSEHTSNGAELAGLVAGYAISLRHSLQGSREIEEAELYLSEEVLDHARRFGNIPTGIAAAISAWIGRERRSGMIDNVLVRTLEEQLGKLVDAQGGCEKILKTPLPFAYASMIKQIIGLYLFTLPFVLFERTGWWSPLLMAVISFALLGMEETSVETEDPFGRDDNCLNMDAFCLTIARDGGQMAAFAAAALLRESQKISDPK
jgi:ion channel-forming bestrophin family protein